MPKISESYELSEHKADPQNLYVEEAFVDGRRWRCRSRKSKLCVVATVLLLAAALGIGLGFGLSGNGSPKTSPLSGSDSTSSQSPTTSPSVSVATSPLPMTTSSSSVAPFTSPIITTTTTNDTSSGENITQITPGSSTEGPGNYSTSTRETSVTNTTVYSIGNTTADDIVNTTVLNGATTENIADHCQASQNNGSLERTVILIKLNSSEVPVFIKGGRPDGDPIPILHNGSDCLPVNCSGLSRYMAWSQDDALLDWNLKAEATQGQYEGQSAQGTPLLFTSDQPDDECYFSLNRYGENYGTVSFWMDCTEAEDNWFSFRTFSPSMEDDITQVRVCQGTGDTISDPGFTDDHYGQCGKINIFTQNAGDCRIENFAE